MPTWGAAIFIEQGKDNLRERRSGDLEHQPFDQARTRHQLWPEGRDMKFSSQKRQVPRLSVWVYAHVPSRWWPTLLVNQASWGLPAVY